MTTPNDSQYEPGADLPSPQFEVPVSPVPEQTEKAPKKAETVSASAELPLSSQAPTAQLQNIADQAVASSVPIAPPVTAKPLPITDEPPLAEDNDLIEQEWVNKAKVIVERTREDPHAQNKEINKFKAGYIKKRYNKEIKVSED